MKGTYVVDRERLLPEKMSNKCQGTCSSSCLTGVDRWFGQINTDAFENYEKEQEFGEEEEEKTFLRSLSSSMDFKD